MSFVTVDPTGLLITQKAFSQINSEYDKNKFKDVKIDGTEDTVHILNTDLFKTYPNPETIQGLDENYVRDVL